MRFTVRKVQVLRTRQTTLKTVVVTNHPKNCCLPKVPNSFSVLMSVCVKYTQKCLSRIITLWRTTISCTVSINLVVGMWLVHHQLLLERCQFLSRWWAKACYRSVFFSFFPHAAKITFGKNYVAHCLVSISYDFIRIIKTHYSKVVIYFNI